MNAPPCIALGELVNPVKTWSPERQARSEFFDYIDLSAIDQAAKAIVGTRELPCSEAPSRARQLVAEGDVLVSTVRPNLNGVARVPAEMDGATASTGFCVLRPRQDRLDGAYLFHWVQSPTFVAEMVRRATGASYPAVSDRIVIESRLPLPPLPKQRRIAQMLDRAQALRAKRRAAVTQLDTFTHSIFLDMFGDPVANPKGWASGTPLGDVAEIVSGITVGRQINDQKVRPVRYLAVVNVQDKALDLSVVKMIEATEEEISRWRLRDDDLLLTEGGDPDKLGRGTLWKGGTSECIHQNHIFRVRLTSDTVDPLFLNWLVGSQLGKSYFLKSAKQTTGIASINMTQLRSFPLLVPPIAVQREFARRVAAADTLKTSHRTSHIQLDALFSSLQDRAFAGEL